MQPEPDIAGHLRIGELSRRVGVSTELLRAWERRYNLLSPTRTAGGFRLYGDRRRAAGAAHAAPPRLGGIGGRGRAPRAGRATRSSKPGRRRRRPRSSCSVPACARRSTASTMPARRRRSTSCSPRSRSRPSCAMPSSRTCTSSASLGARRGVDRAGAFRELAPARADARARARLGQRRLAAGAAGVRAGRPARPRD